MNPVDGSISEGEQAARSPSGIEQSLLSDTLIDLAPDAIFIATLEGRLIEVNARACRQLGYSREELLTLTIADLLPAEDLPRLAAARNALTQDGSQTHTDFWTHRCKDGSRIPVEVSAKILPNGLWLAFVRDLRDRLRLEDDRLRVQQDLEQSQEINRRQLAELEAIYDTAPLPSPTPALASRPTFCRMFLNTSGRRKAVPRGAMAAWAWGFPWCGIWSSCTAARSRLQVPAWDREQRLR